MTYSAPAAWEGGDTHNSCDFHFSTAFSAFKTFVLEIASRREELHFWQHLGEVPGVSGIKQNIKAVFLNLGVAIPLRVK